MHPKNDGTIMIVIRKRSCKWLLFLIVFIVAFWNVISMIRQLPSQMIANWNEISIYTTSTTNKEITFGPEGWSDVKLLIYMTTHLPQEHVAFLPCWNDAVQRLDIFKYADLMMYTSSEPAVEHLELLPFRNTTVKLYTNPGYQSGAVQAMVDPFLDNETSWFDEYDWVIRVNPDVLIRADEWLMQTMLNTSVDMIVHECSSVNRYTVNTHLHTDFFAFRPSAVDRDLLLQADRNHAETHFTAAFRHLYDAGRFIYVEGARNPMEGICRIEGNHSPIVHNHEMAAFCPYYYNATKEGFFR